MKVFYLDPGRADLLSGEFLALFSTARKQQIAGMTHPESKRDAAAAEALLHAALYSLCPDYAPPLSYARDGRGKPYFPDGRFFFSLSHANGCAACAISDGDVGVDLEFDRCFSPRLLDKIACPGDADLPPLYLWTAKEAVMKKTGMGLGLLPSRIRIGEDAAYVDEERVGNLFFFPVPGGMIAAVSGDGDAEFCALGENELILSARAKI